MEEKFRIPDPEQAKQRILATGVTLCYLNNKEHDFCFDYPDESASGKKGTLIVRFRKPVGPGLTFMKGVNEDGINTIKMS